MPGPTHTIAALSERNKLSQAFDHQNLPGSRQATELQPLTERLFLHATKPLNSWIQPEAPTTALPALHPSSPAASLDNAPPVTWSSAWGWKGFSVGVKSE